MSLTRPALALLIAAVVAAPLTARAATFTVKPGGKTKVVFASKAPIEAFEGKTSKMTGTIMVDPAAVGDSLNVHLEVDLASLDTGIAKRNQHMRENHLETGKYPKAGFDGATVLSPRGATLEPGVAKPFRIEGNFTLHGVTRRIQVDATATYAAAGGGAITFTAAFPVSLPDYNISRPQFLFMKLAEVQQVTVAGVAVASP